MRISDWSSDVCSSDLRDESMRARCAVDRGVMDAVQHREAALRDTRNPVEPLDDINVPERTVHVHRLRKPARDRDAELPPVAGPAQARVAHMRPAIDMPVLDPMGMVHAIGRASCRERVCQYVYI